MSKGENKKREKVLVRRIQKKIDSGDYAFTDKKERGSFVRSRIPELFEKEIALFI